MITTQKTVVVGMSPREVGTAIANQCSITEIKEIIAAIHSNSSYWNKDSVATAIKQASDKINPPKPSFPGFRGKTFVLTGRFAQNKAYWQNYIVSRGGVVKATVTDYVDYLVIEQGKANGTLSIKAKNALSSGVKIITTDELQRL